ncbi:efflux RND transporter periplasmic adaptor subunit [Falsigemmobacter intermedius]|uniref:Efflux RND transporter periplasmic adaptor subunit n=2 Tax=Falsigemmobacter intermedius TaxID=1553448 RepID=A0A3S3Y8J7_9RHOB|nr:efflux RND transporter periplasmic adaptor subunit [Falsigemmobacter intermedius]
MTTLLLLLPLAAAQAVAQGAPGGAPPPAPVGFVPVEITDHQITARLPGRVKASTVAEVRPQVSGIIREQLFEEGRVINAGDPLFKIEDDSYRAAVAAARAAVTQAKASYELSITEEKRALELFGNNAGSAQRRDAAVASRQSAEAGLQAAEARLMSAEIDLERTTIRAPISGVVGLSQATIGALVAAQQPAPLATIRQLDPVHVDVTQSAVDLLRYTSTPEGREMQNTGEAEMTLSDGTSYSVKGRLSAAEPQVEPTTGMITLRMTYPNPDHVLLPGMYVEVHLPQAIVRGSALVPQNAVLRDRSGATSVWVIENGAVAVRPVKVAGTAGNEWVIQEGLKAGDQVITSGFQKTGPGAPVTPVPEGGAAAPAADAPAETKGD